MTRPFRPARLPAAGLCASAALLAAPGLAAEPDARDVAFDVPSFADVEPDVVFPACVGIARIVDGAVTRIPIGEAAAWDAQFDLLGDAVGRKVDVLMTGSADPAQAITDLRQDALAAGLNYAVIYELAYDEAPGEGPSAIELLRVFPTFEGERGDDPAPAAGAAVLMDVADGAMYGIASAIVLETESGGYGASDRTRAGAFEAVVSELAHEVETAFVGIMIKAGLPDPHSAVAEADPEDLTPEQVIAQADREFMAATADQAGDRGC